jgi:hypothetical protein
MPSFGPYAMYRDFGGVAGLGVPAGASINGIEVLIDDAIVETGKTGGMTTWRVELSGDGGTTWTAEKFTGDINCEESNWTTCTPRDFTLGGPIDPWGGTWTSASFSNASFRARIRARKTISGGIFVYLDSLQVKVYYSDCGDGVVEGGEQCDQGVANGTPGSCCSATCTFEAAGTGCTSDGLECTDDQCNAVGMCIHAIDISNTCGSPDDTPCDNPDSCSAAGVCLSNNVAPTTACGDAEGACTNQDFCSGTGTCIDNGFKPAITTCGDAEGACTNQDFCSGTSGACTDNGFKAATTTCGDAEGVCTNQDFCSGTSGACTDNGFKPATTACGDAEGVCTNQDFCSGTSGACTDNGFKAATTTCGDAEGVCTNQDFCSGTSGACTDNGFKAPGDACGDQNDTDCSNPNTCDASHVCQPNDEPNGSDCPEDSNECTDDVCDEAGACTHPPKPPNTPCGSSSDTECTDPDTCDGAGNCEKNKESNGTPCNEGDICTSPDSCESGECTAGPRVGCKVTGGGQLTTGGDKVSVGVNAQTTGSGYKGQVEYTNHTDKTAYHSTRITGLAITSATSCPDGKKATITGKIKKKGNPTEYDFTLIVEVCGEPGRNDTFSIEISDGEYRGGTLDRGNIQVY